MCSIVSGHLCSPLELTVYRNYADCFTINGRGRGGAKSVLHTFPSWVTLSGDNRRVSGDLWVAGGKEGRPHVQPSRASGRHVSERKTYGR